MDRETAIDLLDNLIGMVEDSHESDYDTAIKMGIDALKEKTQLSEEDATKDATSDCIDRKAAIEALRRAEALTRAFGYHNVIETIRELPSAQPEIIRCKDCKYFDPLTEDFDYNFCDAWAGGTNEDMFCGFAERRQDADSSGNMSGTQKELKCTETHSCDYQRTETHESCTDCPLYDHDRHNCPRFNRVIPATIEAAKPRWIPVTEALPRDDEDVIVTCLDDSGDTPYSYTTVAWHYKGMWVCDNMRCLFVIAWMPLPEPMRETE